MPISELTLSKSSLTFTIIKFSGHLLPYFGLKLKNAKENQWAYCTPYHCSQVRDDLSAASVYSEQYTFPKTVVKTARLENTICQRVSITKWSCTIRSPSSRDRQNFRFIILYEAPAITSTTFVFIELPKILSIFLLVQGHFFTSFTALHMLLFPILATTKWNKRIWLAEKLYGYEYCTITLCCFYFKVLLLLLFSML